MTGRLWDKYLSDRDRQLLDDPEASAWGDPGRRPALLVIDVSYAFTGDRPEDSIEEAVKRYPTACGKEAWDAVAVNRRLIDAAHDKGIPVIYTTAAPRADGWDKGGWLRKKRSAPSIQRPPNLRDPDAIVDEIAPQKQDLVVIKQKPSGFFATPLLSYLVTLGCDSVIVTGGTTCGCVRATAVDAFNNNYRVTVVEDACFDRGEASHAISLFDINHKYGAVISSPAAIDYLRGLPDDLFPNRPRG